LFRPFFVLLGLLSLGLTNVALAQPTSLDQALRAALEGDAATLRSLLDRGAEADSTDAEGNTLLMLAARGGHLPAMELLLERKASLGRRNSFGDNAVLVAAANGSPVPLSLLIAKGAEINPEGWTPLHYAAFTGKEAAVKLLLERGANKDAVAPNGYTPLMLSARGGHVEAARVLLFEDPDVNYRTETGDTALKISLQREMREIAALLRRAGAVE